MIDGLVDGRGDADNRYEVGCRLGDENVHASPVPDFAERIRDIVLQAIHRTAIQDQARSLIFGAEPIGVISLFQTANRARRESVYRQGCNPALPLA